MAKIIVAHCEFRDEVYWKYGLRNELPPVEALVGIKQLDLSFNKLGEYAICAIGKAVKADRYLLALNLRYNQIQNYQALNLITSLNHNNSLFNLDLRDNLDVKQKVFRKLALKLLESYTSVGK